MTPTDPYAWLARSPNVKLRIQRLPDGEMGRWIPGASTIVIDDRLTQAERRCTVMHELVHRLHEDLPDLPEHLLKQQERACEMRTAQFLIDLDDLLDALLWCYSEHEDELADHLWVDVSTLQDRIRYLTTAEKTYLLGKVRNAAEWVA